MTGPPPWYEMNITRRQRPPRGRDRRARAPVPRILEYCPAGLNVVDEEGRLLFHNARLRELMGYDEEEMHLFDTRRFWHDLDQRGRIIETLRERRRPAPE